ncbi:hypothetical protein [Streptomyces sp. bgisy154]
MTEEEYDELLGQIVADELHMHYAAVAGVAEADDLEELSTARA